MLVIWLTKNFMIQEEESGESETSSNTNIPQKNGGKCLVRKNQKKSESS